MPHDRLTAMAGQMPAETDTCAQEPIHVPGTIQAHGALLAVDPLGGWIVVAASHNAASLLGIGPVLGRDVAAVLGAGFTTGAQTRFAAGRLRGHAPWEGTLTLGAATFDTIVHSHDGLVLMEFERTRERNDIDALTSVHQLREAIIDLRETEGDLHALARVAASGIRSMTGFDRVLVYRFDSKWNGVAIGEVKSADWAQSLDGLRFPAGDIPSQARELYRRSPVRWIPDRDAAPVPLEAGPAWSLGRPNTAVDLSFARLRSLSPVHLDFHRNMGVNGSMSLSILLGGNLWGLLVCHHRTPLYLSAGQRAAVASLTDAFALRVGPAERLDNERARRGDLERLSVLLAHMAQAEEVTAALTTGEVTVGDLFAATGAAVLYDGNVALVGQTPSAVIVRALADWIRGHLGSAKLFETDNLTAAYSDWQRFTTIASGVLAVALSPERPDMLLWFRPEEPHLVNWGGSPHQSGEAANLPRNSFERWTETRRGFAKPWAAWELEMAESLRHGITEVMVRGLQRLADLHAKLRQSQKMEAVGQLTGGIAHDFNNLLAGITGSLDLMKTRMAQGRTGELDRYIGAAAASANRAAALTHRLLAFSRRQTLDPRAIDVNRLISSMEDLIRRTVGPGIHVETVIPGELWQTLCDGNQLENALLNLAINARDAMPDGGRLTIEAGNARLDDSYARSHPEVAPGQYVVMSITDDGFGMEPDVVARAFEPFFTTKPPGQGTGLGLPMVHGFAMQSNGHASIYSEPGQGTTVRLYLPRHVGLAQAEPRPAAPMLTTSTAAGVVLLVDDEPVVRMLACDMLRDAGYELIEAADGAEGLAVLEAGREIDLLVTDIGLPGGMNGWQLADTVRLSHPLLRVLFITGFAESAVMDKGVLAPGMQLLTKPFAMDNFVAKVGLMIQATVQS